MLIFVADLKGTSYEVDINVTDTIEFLKEKLEEITGYSVCQQRLIFAGRQLEDHRTIQDYHIQKESLLKLILRMRGC